MSFFTSRSNTFIFVFLFLAAFFIRLFFVVFFKFDGLYGQDAYAYADWSNRFYVSLINFKIPPDFYWPIGFYLFTSLFGLLLGGNTGTAALLLSLNAGALTAGFMYLLAFEAFPESPGRKYIALISGLIICFAGAAVKSSIVIMSDAPALLFLTISAYNLVVYVNKHNRINLVVCFIAFSFGLMTRYADGLFIAVIFILLLFARKKPADKKKTAIDLIFAAIAGFIIYLPQAYYVLNFGVANLQNTTEYSTWASAWNPLNIFRKDFISLDGIMHYRLWNGLFYVSPVFHPMFLSLFGIAFLFGFFTAVKKRYKMLLVFCIGWSAVYYLYLSGNPYQSLRYTLSYFPPMVLISAWGLGELKIKQVYRSAYIIICFLVLIVYGYYDIERLMQNKDKELEEVEWINTNVPPGAKLFTFGITGAVNHYGKTGAQEIFNYKFSGLESSIDSSGGTAYLFIPVNEIKTQWKGYPFVKNIDSIRSIHKMTSIGKINEYEGFRIEK